MPTNLTSKEKKELNELLDNPVPTRAEKARISELLGGDRLNFIGDNISPVDSLRAPPKKSEVIGTKEGKKIPISLYAGEYRRRNQSTVGDGKSLLDLLSSDSTKTVDVSGGPLGFSMGRVKRDAVKVDEQSALDEDIAKEKPDSEEQQAAIPPPVTDTGAPSKDTGKSKGTGKGRGGGTGDEDKSKISTEQELANAEGAIQNLLEEERDLASEYKRDDEAVHAFKQAVTELRQDYKDARQMGLYGQLADKFAKAFALIGAAQSGANPAYVQAVEPTDWSSMMDAAREDLRAGLDAAKTELESEEKMGERERQQRAIDRAARLEAAKAKRDAILGRLGRETRAKERAENFAQQWSMLNSRLRSAEDKADKSAQDKAEKDLAKLNKEKQKRSANLIGNLRAYNEADASGKKRLVPLIARDAEFLGVSDVKDKKGKAVNLIANLDEVGTGTGVFGFGGDDIDIESVAKEIRSATPSTQDNFPRTVTKGNQRATVKNQQELDEALAEGFK